MSEQNAQANGGQPFHKTPISEAAYRRDGNIFAILGVCRAAMKRDRQNPPDVQARLVQEMTERATHSGSYHAALAVTLEYVDLVDDEDEEGD